MQRVDLHHALAPGTAEIEIDNPWGDIYVRRNNQRAVDVHAVVQQLGDPAAPADVRLDGDDRSAKLRVRFAGAGSDCRRRHADGVRYGRADVTVFVPADVRLQITSDCDGRINTDHVVGDLKARTDAGNISTSASGRARIRSDSGMIRAFLQAESALPSSLRTRGSIVLTMPPAVRVEIDALACGGLRSPEFNWQPEPAGAGCERAHAVIGEAASRLDVASLASFVELRLRGTARQ